LSYIVQREDEWEAEQRKKDKDAKKPKGPYCYECGKRMHDSGRLKKHLRDKHSYTQEMWKVYVVAHTKKDYL
jgi:hypothetical protein